MTKSPWFMLAAVLAVSAVLAPSAWSQKTSESAAKVRIPVAKSELQAPRFHATGQLSVVRAPGDGDSQKVEVLRTFGAGAAAEVQAKAFAATAVASAASGSAPAFVRRNHVHLRCPQPGIDNAGSRSDTDCPALKISYVIPAVLPADPKESVECNVSVDVDVLVLGRRARSMSWELSPPPATVPTADGPKPLIRLLEFAKDPAGQDVRGITFFDNTDHPRERGGIWSPDPQPMFNPTSTSADGQKAVWTRATDGRRSLRKSFYYAVVLQVWNDARQDYVFCNPYDPLVANRGN